MTPSAVGGQMIHLLGRPHLDGPVGGYRMRGRKSWALLAYLLLSERPATRRHLASLLFEQADDPFGALRWGLSELRRALAGHAVIGGDPVALRRRPGVVADVEVVADGSWQDAVRLSSLGCDLLEGLSVGGAVAFESWLLSERHRLATASEDVLNRAVTASIEHGALQNAIDYAVRLLSMAPLNEHHHAVLIGLYRMAGDDGAARRQYAACRQMLAVEFGTLPSPALCAVLHDTRPASAARRAPVVSDVLTGPRLRSA